MDGDIHRQGVARLVGHDHGLLLAGGPEPELAVAVQGLLPAVHGDLVDVLVTDLQVCLIAEIIVPAVGHVLDHREGGVQLEALAAGIGHIAGVVGELGIDDILVIAGELKGLAIFIEDAFLQALLSQRLDGEEVLDLHRVLRLVIARLGVAVVVRGDLDGDFFLKEQAEGNGVQQGLPPGAVLDLDLACGGGGVRHIVAVLAAAEGADSLLEIAGLAVVYAAVMRAGIAALGALAVNIGIMSVGLDNAFFTVNKGDIYVFSLSRNLPIRFVFNINILAVLIKKHTSVGKNSFQPRIIEVGGTHITVDNSVMQRCRCDFYRRMRSPYVTHGERPCKGTVDYRKASAENISRIGTGTFKSVTGNQFHPIQCYRSAVNFQSAGT